MDESEFALEATVAAPTARRGRPKGSAKKPKPVATAPELELADTDSVNYLHRAKRLNNPPAGLAAEGRAAEPPRLAYAYNPHRPPLLRFDGTGRADRAAELAALAAQRALTAEESEALQALLRVHEPWIEWAGKQEKPGFEVDPVALHIHERVSTQAILRAVQRQDSPRSLFADPDLDPAKDLQFYQHSMDWANRMVLGDSLQVMASLARREGLAGQVQMIYLDPPYGIKFASNFQPEVGRRDVKDRDGDLTREPEMVRAYRDTWTLGVHTYLAYLRDRLMMARELLADTGSIFVQISDENLHRVRMVMDEVFGAENAVSLIQYRTTGGFPGNTLSRTGDYLLWYAKDSLQTKYRPIYAEKSIEDDDNYRYVQLQNGVRLTILDNKEVQANHLSARVFRMDNTSGQGSSGGETPLDWEGRVFNPPNNSHWKASFPDGMNRLAKAERFFGGGSTLSYVRYADDYAVKPITNTWMDTGVSGFASDKLFVVQTLPTVIERCLLMTTDPGDLVLDPTCGSGTTAYVAEQWGRRWIRAAWLYPWRDNGS